MIRFPERWLSIAYAVLIGIAGQTSSHAQERFHFNDLKTPKSRQDLEAIQSALIQALPQARRATVCLEIGEGSGSGVIISPDGLILTAAHVATGSHKKLKVILEDGTKLNGITLGLNSETDAAMVRITDPPKEGGWPHAPVDRDQQTRLGDWVFSLGHSGGFNADRGSVVRLGRVVRMAASTWQTDSTLIGGDSGGPLFDLHGRVIGIHSQVGKWIGENMSVPIPVFTEVWDRLLAGEFIGEGPFAKKPVKGSGFLGLASDSNPQGGLRVTKVGKETPAAVAGIREGDVLTKLNGTELKDRTHFQSLLKELAAGDEITLELLRAGNPQSLTLNLGER